MQGTIVYLIICNYVRCRVVTLGEKESAGIAHLHRSIVTSISLHSYLSFHKGYTNPTNLGAVANLPW